MKRSDKLTKEQLERNIKKLEEKLPVKPDVFTNDFPVSIQEAFYKYLRQSTIGNISTKMITVKVSLIDMPLFMVQVITSTQKLMQ